MDGLIRAAEASRSPLIVQISVKTVEFWGADVVKGMFTNMARRVAAPVTLHLDHCPDTIVARACLEVGWNSVLFDGSGLSYEENFQQEYLRDSQARQPDWGHAVWLEHGGEFSVGVRSTAGGIGTVIGAVPVRADPGLRTAPRQLGRRAEVPASPTPARPSPRWIPATRCSAPVFGMAVFAGWVVLAIVGAAVALKRRDA